MECLTRDAPYGEVCIPNFSTDCVCEHMLAMCMCSQINVIAMALLINGGVHAETSDTDSSILLKNDGQYAR